MGSIKSRRTVVPLMIAALALPASAAGEPLKDYSKNGATGDYAPQKVYKDYSKNGATGDFAPATTSASPQPVVRVVRQNDQSFAWGDAALGSASTLILVMFFGITTRRVRRRRIPAPAPARPSAA